MADDFDAKIKQKAKTESKYSCSVCGRTFVCVPFKHLANGKICDGQVAEEKWILVDDILAVYAETQRQHKQQLQDLLNNFPDCEPCPNGCPYFRGLKDTCRLYQWKEKFEELLSEGSSRMKKVQGLEHG